MLKLLETPFKGERHYVHGTSLFDGAEAELRERFGDGAYISHLTIRRMARTACALVYHDEYMPGISKPVASLRYWDGRSFQKGIIEETGHAIVDRVAYPEADIVKDARIDGMAIHHAQRTRFTVVEEIVALTKAVAHSKSA
jgi:hypothetical protein